MEEAQEEGELLLLRQWRQQVERQDFGKDVNDEAAD